VFGGSKAELRAQFPELGPDASLEDLFFHAVEGVDASTGSRG
jgi:hypothetical protein